MKEFIKNNLVVIIAFLLPVLFVVGVMVSIYMPFSSVSTKYNFIYATCDSLGGYYYDCTSYINRRYDVVDGKLVIKDFSQKYNSNGSENDPSAYQVVVPDGVTLPKTDQEMNDRIFLHDTETNQSREITKEEAKTLSLNSFLSSPDGVSVSGGYNGGGCGLFFVFGCGRSTYEYYLMKGNIKSKLNLISTKDQYYYPESFKFIGWVLPGRN